MCANSLSLLDSTLVFRIDCIPFALLWIMSHIGVCLCSPMDYVSYSIIAWSPSRFSCVPSDSLRGPVRLHLPVYFNPKLCFMRFLSDQEIVSTVFG